MNISTAGAKTLRATKAHERDKLERLCRYIARPAVVTHRLSMTRNGAVRYELKSPYSDGATHVLFEPLDFIARLVALVPKPRVNLFNIDLETEAACLLESRVPPQLN